MKTLIFSMALSAFVFSAFCQDKSLAKVNRHQGILIFNDCTPVQDHDYLGAVTRSTGGFGCSQYLCVRDGLIKRALNDFPDLDALIIKTNNDGKDVGEAIKFLE